MKSHKNTYRFLLILTVVLLLLAGAIGQDEQQNDTKNADKTLSPYFFVKGDPNVDHLPLKDTRANVAVSGVIADVHVTQTYRNEGTRPINATYVFPASTRAAVYAMQMKIGDEIIVAKIKEREQAKQEFEKAKKEGKSASLLEQQRPNVFTMSLANLMPQEEVEIELRYTELLVPTDGVYEFVYPTVVGPRYPSDAKSDKSDDKFVSTPYLHQDKDPTSALHISARVAAGMPITEISCPSHQIAPQWVNSTTAELRLDDANPFQGNRDFVLHYRLSGNQIASGLLLFQGQDENYFLYMAEPPERIKPEDIPPRDYVFVVDVSGSMDGFPLNTAKQLLKDLIGGMRPSDYFNVVLFAGDSTVLSEKPLQANQENVSRAIDLLEQQRGAGGTELLPAVQQAMSLLREPNTARSVVLVTDGYISGEQGVFDYVREHLGKSNMFAFGIGSAVNRYLIEGVAKAGMGEPFIVEQESGAADAAAKFREYIESPVLTNIHIKANGFETFDVQPGKLPDLFARRPVILFGKWRGTPSGTFELTGRNGQGEFHNVFDVSSVQPDEGNSALRYLWARSRIAELSDYGFGEPSESRIKEITELGLKYNLLTRYTSFIAVR
ncbi:MAG TPA: VIT and VWA domain-containing protein, partial [Pyrinomonadaceae bacterium]|nr:VIT and VWA domain-containing protein [Pyrinomonadaceae bacterium]